VLLNKTNYLCCFSAQIVETCESDNDWRLGGQPKSFSRQVRPFTSKMNDFFVCYKKIGRFEIMYWEFNSFFRSQRRDDFLIPRVNNDFHDFSLVC
jgi:hypothetical protein